MSKQKWTTADIPNLAGKVIIVTGGNSGLGYESVKAFAEKGATVIIGSRSMDKAEAAKKEIAGQLSKAKIEVIQLDLMELKSVKTFVQQFKSQYNRLDVLLNNAGIMMNPYTLTKDGFESQMGTNHLGHFALTGLLIDLIKATSGSRVVNVSSNAHKWGKMDFSNLLFEKGKDYTPMKAYGRSKLANLLFTYELQKRFDAGNTTSMAIAAHPGASMTNLGRYMEDKLFFKLLLPFAGIMTQNQASGALPQIRAAVDPAVKPAQYYGPDGFNQMKGAPVVVESNAASHNADDASMLWEASEKLTGVAFSV
jgi:NAD(P)-dependent dehydrogenase (short-subunit alcohol dehydrogenase family)